MVNNDVPLEIEKLSSYFLTLQEEELSNWIFNTESEMKMFSPELDTLEQENISDIEKSKQTVF